MEKNMIDTVVFDIGMVLVDFCWREFLKECNITGEAYRQIEENIFMSDMWDEFDKGIEDEKIIEMCYNAVPDYREEVEHMLKNIGHMTKEYDYAAPLIRSLKERGKKVYLLSNFAGLMYKEASKYFSFKDMVDGKVVSYEVKKVKPDPAIYRILIEKYNIDPKKAVFLDDRQENIEAAQKEGFHTILFKDSEKALKELEKMLQ